MNASLIDWLMEQAANPNWEADEKAAKEEKQAKKGGAILTYVHIHHWSDGSFASYVGVCLIPWWIDAKDKAGSSKAAKGKSSEEKAPKRAKKEKKEKKDKDPNEPKVIYDIMMNAIHHAP